VSRATGNAVVGTFLNHSGVSEYIAVLRLIVSSTHEAVDPDPNRDNLLQCGHRGSKSRMAIRSKRQRLLTIGFFYKLRISMLLHAM
jgi:hypothetical protein